MSPLARSVFDVAVHISIWCGIFEPWNRRGVRLYEAYIAGILVFAAEKGGFFDWVTECLIGK